MSPNAMFAIADRATCGFCSWPLRRQLRVLWVILVAATFCSLPALLLEMNRKKWAAHYVAWFLAGLFSLLTLPITLYEIALHLEYFSCPPLQRHIVRILLMPPIYALDSWFCLRFISARTMLTPIRELFEAYTIYNFFMYLMRYLESHVGCVADYMEAKRISADHIFPMNWFWQPWVGRELFTASRNGVLNYVIVRPSTAVAVWLTLVTTPDNYVEGRFGWRNVWTWTTCINNISQAWALYMLLLFHLALHEELKPLNPIRKLVTIKLVVFASFWQGLVITLLASLGVLRPRESWRTYTEPSEISGGLQDFIICIEMFFAAMSFAWAFPPRDYMTGEPPGFWSSVRTVLDFTDVVDDVQERVNKEYQEMSSRPMSFIFMPWLGPLFTRPAKPCISLQGNNDAQASELTALTLAFPPSAAATGTQSTALMPLSKVPTHGSKDMEGSDRQHLLTAAAAEDAAMTSPSVASLGNGPRGPPGAGRGSRPMRKPQNLVD